MSVSTKLNKDSIIVTDEMKLLTIEAISQITSGKINRGDYPAHGGYFSKVELSDKSFFFKDFPSIQWTKLEELSKLIESNINMKK